LEFPKKIGFKDCGKEKRKKKKGEAWEKKTVRATKKQKKA
jgi:hypothetical protein